MENRNTRGSEWRKWDLHIHTPFTKLNNNFKSEDGKDLWELYCNRIEQSDVIGFGITDYFSVDNYFTFIDKFKKVYPNSSKTFFPNIEFRLEVSVNSQAEEVNLHVIFSNIIAKVKIEEFLGKLDTNITYNGAKVSCKLLKDNQTSSACIDYKQLRMKLKEVFGNDDCYLIFAAANNQGLRPERSLRKLIITDEIDKVCDGFFGGSQNVDHFLKSDRFENDELSVPKPVIACSDAHSFDDIENWLGKQFIRSNNGDQIIEKNVTWIKADPTFNGLKQIIYEPKERVKIQPNKPEEKPGYYVIDSIDLDEDTFWKQNILLNPNLNTIIGGRSTGKSTLLNCIACNIDPSMNFDAFINEHIKGVTIQWQDKELSPNRDIEFFPQSYMYDIARDSTKLDKLIERIIHEKDENRRLSIYHEFCDENRSAIINKINSLFQIQTSIDKQKINIKEKGDKQGVEKEIKTLEERITSLDIGHSISQQTLSEFDQINQAITDNEQKLLLINKDLIAIKELKSKSIFNQAFEFELNTLSVATRKAVLNTFNKIKTDTLNVWQKQIGLQEDDLEKEKLRLASLIDKDKIKDNYIKGQENIRNNSQYQDLQDKLKIERKKITDIIEVEQTLQNLERQKKELNKEIIELHFCFYDKAKGLTNSLKLECGGIAIVPSVQFNDGAMRNFFDERLNQKGFERQNYVSGFVQDYHVKITEKIGDFLDQALNKKIEFKGIYTDKSQPTVSSELLSTNWFSITYKLTCQNDLFSEMSQGKQAFVILKLLLEFSDKKCPILIDQPEDSLDNRAIYHELVEYLKGKKKERQIVLVTHNPNVVVGADAEEIIVANQHGKDSENRDSIRFQYISGSLENTIKKNTSGNIVLESQGIREHVCEILEGGDQAFKKREQKYGMKVS